MSRAITALIGGFVFILLGRWVYREPNILTIRSLYANPEGRFLRLGPKIFATLLIFGGAYAVVTGPAAVVMPDARWCLFLYVGLAVLGAYFLRPRGVRVPRTLAGPNTSSIGQGGGLLTRKGRALVGVSLGSGALFFVTMLAVLWLGKSNLIPAVTVVFAAVIITAIAVVLWLVK